MERLSCLSAIRISVFSNACWVLRVGCWVSTTFLLITAEQNLYQYQYLYQYLYQLKTNRGLYNRT